jgi:hypothetical protein
VTFSDCTAAANPDGVAGKEWCAVEPGLAGTDWAYCAPKSDYASLRSAVQVGFAAKAEEAHRSILSVQQLSRNLQAEIKQYHEVRGERPHSSGVIPQCSRRANEAFLRLPRDRSCLGQGEVRVGLIPCERGFPAASPHV